MKTPTSNLNAKEFAKIIWGIPEDRVESFLNEMMTWVKDMFPPLDPLKLIRRHGSTKKITRARIFNQLFNFLKKLVYENSGVELNSNKTPEPV